MEYDITIVSEFKIGELTLPFRFNLSSIRAFPKQQIISDKFKYKGDESKSWLRQRLFQYAYLDYFDIELDDTEYLESYDEDEYEFKNGNLKIKSPNLFFDILTDVCGRIEDIVGLRNFIDENELKIMTMYLERLKNDLEYDRSDDLNGNSNTHILCSVLGDTSINPTPFFAENLGVAIYDWSWREVQLRSFYKSKTFKIENAIQAEKNRLEKQAYDDMKKKSR